VTEEHPDAIAYRRTADAFRAGDLDLVRTLVAPEVVWHVPGDHHMAGRIDGRDALLAWLARLGTIGFWLVEHDVFASDQHVCAISTMGARRAGVDVETRVISIFRYHEGQQVERWLYPDDTNAWRAIFTV
jgi:ketosteroid isomerase-like protein